MAHLLEPGSPAPDFEAKNQQGEVVRLHDFAGKPVVLYFYPEDGTLGCTREACAFRDDTDEFRKRGAVVLGVSVQDETSHREFWKKYDLTFDLIADPDKHITKAYGALGLLGLAKRVTFVIGRDGRIVKTFSRIDPKGHSAEALRILESERERVAP
jgi:thioredoxin-dependent peroxiredoxin